MKANVVRRPSGAPPKQERQFQKIYISMGLNMIAHTFTSIDTGATELKK